MNASPLRVRVLFALFALGLVVPVGVALLPASSPEPVRATDLKHVAGRWYLREGKPPVYFYKDGDRFVDLFSYHARDSNKDGIDNVRLSHDARFLIVESQGYPNHPTALFPNSRNPN